MSKSGIRSSAIIIKNTRILLMHRKKGFEYWTFPGGGVEDGETWEEAVVREVKEETGLITKSVDLLFMAENSEGGIGHPFYLCKVNDAEAKLGGEELIRNSEDNSYQLEWVSVDSLNKINLLPESAKKEVQRHI